MRFWNYIKDLFRRSQPDDLVSSKEDESFHPHFLFGGDYITNDELAKTRLIHGRLRIARRGNVVVGLYDDNISDTLYIGVSDTVKSAS